MKKILLLFIAAFASAAFIFNSCSTPASITSWKNPEVTSQISKIMVMGLADKMTYVKPAEEILSGYFAQRNLPALMALNYLDPFTQYTMEQIQAKLDPLGVDGILLLSSKGQQTSLNVDPGFYGGYRVGWGGAWGSSISTSTTYTVRATLYDSKSGKMMWSGDIQFTDPNDTASGMTDMAQAIFNDWVKNGLLKNPPPPATK
jgi:hypothetical protein